MADACLDGSRTTSRFAVGQLLASAFLYSMSGFALAPILPAIAEHFRLPVQLQALPYSANFAGATIASIVAGYASESMGKTKVLRVALIGLAASGLAALFSSVFWLILAGVFAAGVFGATLQLMAVSLVSDMYPAEKGYYVNFVQSFIGVGAVVGSFLAGAFSSSFGSWRAFFLLVAAVPLIVFAAFRSARYPETTGKAPSLRSLGGMIGQSAFYVPVISLMLYVGAEVGLASWMCIYLTEKFGLSAFHTGTVASGFWLGLAAGRLVIAHLSRRHAPHSLIFVNLLLAACCVIGGITARSSLLAAAFFLATGLFYGGILPTNLVIIGNHFPRVAATAFGFALTVANLGGIALPWVVGTLAVSLDLTRALAFTAIISVVNAVLVGATFFRGKRQTAASA